MSEPTPNCRDSFPGTSLRVRGWRSMRAIAVDCRDSFPGTSLRVIVAEAVDLSFRIAGILFPALH